MEQRCVHVRDDERHSDHGQRGDVRRVRMHDGLDLRSRAINPEMKAIGRVRHPVAFEHVQVVIDQQEIIRADLVEAQTEAQHVVRARFVASGSHLAGKSGIVPSAASMRQVRASFWRADHSGKTKCCFIRSVVWR